MRHYFINSKFHSVSLVLFVLLISSVTFSQIPQTYTTFYNVTVQRYAWSGNKIMLLSESNTLNPVTMNKWALKLDTAYNYYALCTGREPTPNVGITYINNRATIAQVGDGQSCGVGCGHLGATGIEIQNPYFTDAYNYINTQNLYEQIPFYELGRNFWFYDSKLEYLQDDPIETGYAVFMRFITMEAAHVNGAPFGTTPFATFKNDVVNLLSQYMANQNLNWGNTLGVGQGVPNNYGGTDLFASFCFYLRDHYGGNYWVENVWKYAGARPDAVTTQDAVDNFIIAASQAAHTNLVGLFQNWRWPVSNNAIQCLATLDYSVFSPPANVCTPSGIANPTNGFDIGPRNVTLANMSVNTSGYTDDNYQYYIDHTIAAGGSCPQPQSAAYLDNNLSHTITVTTGLNPENVRGWIDFNNNGIFETSELIISSNGNIENQTHSATFNIPSNAVSGVPLRMRVASDFYAALPPGPCTNPEYGQAEDFIVMVTAGTGFVWIGAINTAWNTPGNWSGGQVPNTTSEVVINSGTVILNSNTLIKKIRLGSGASLTITGGHALTVLQ